MKISFVTPAYPPAFRYGGPVAKIAVLASALRARGHGVDVWTTRLGLDDEVLPLPDGDEEPPRYMRRILSYRWSAICPFATVVGLTTDADVVHCFGYWDGVGTLAGLGRAARQRPYVVEPLGMLGPATRGHRRRRVFHLAASRYLHGAASIIAASDQEADLIKKYTDQGVAIRHNPLQLAARQKRERRLRQSLGVRDDDLLVTFVGRISRTKAVHLLVDAVRDTAGAVCLLIGPDDNDGAMAQVEVAVRRSRGAVRYLGPLWGTNRDRILASSDVFVLPSASESFGNAIFDAAAQGLPVIVTQSCGAAPLVEDARAGLIVESATGALAQALATLRDDVAFRLSLAQRAEKLAAAVEPGRIAAQQELIYAQCLS